MNLSQIAPYPTILAEMVEKIGYKSGWEFTLEDLDRGQGSRGLTLCILIHTPDSYHPGSIRSVWHYMLVPPAAYNEQSWRRWLLDQVLLVEQHEACEFFKLGEFRPFAPIHAPGNDPYAIRELTTDEERRTSYKGELNP